MEPSNYNLIYITKTITVTELVEYLLKTRYTCIFVMGLLLANYIYYAGSKNFLPMCINEYNSIIPQQPQAIQLLNNVYDLYHIKQQLNLFTILLSIAITTFIETILKKMFYIKNYGDPNVELKWINTTWTECEGHYQLHWIENSKYYKSAVALRFYPHTTFINPIIGLYLVYMIASFYYFIKYMKPYEHFSDDNLNHIEPIFNNTASVDNTYTESMSCYICNNLLFIEYLSNIALGIILISITGLGVTVLIINAIELTNTYICLPIWEMFSKIKIHYYDVQLVLNTTHDQNEEVVNLIA